MRALIADLVVEFTPRYDNLIHLAAPFRYDGNRKTDLHLAVSDKSLSHLMRCASFRTNTGQMETHAFSGEFNRLAMEHNVMLLHSSALVYDGGAYLFSAPSGGGKSTHTRLWLQTFGDRVHIMNDDKPALRLESCQVLCCGTPFDGGSGIALNETFPLKAIVFLNKGENNSVHIPTTGDILRRIFFQASHSEKPDIIERKLDFFNSLITQVNFYELTSNTDPIAAYTAFNVIIGKSHQ